MFSHLSSLDTPARLLVAWLDIHYVGLGRRAELDFRVCDEIPKQEELPPEEDTAAPEVRCSACDLGFASSAAFREHVKSSSHVERVSELWRSSLGSSEAPKDPGLGEEGLEYLRGHDFGEQQADDSLSVFFHGTLSNSAPSLLHQMLRDLAVQSPEPRNHSARAVEWRVSRKLNDPGPSVPKRRKGKQTQSQPSSSGSQGSASIVLKCWRAPLDISSYQTRHPHLARCSGCAYRVALWEWFGIEALGLRPGLERRHWAVLMAHGGRFAGGIFDMYGGKPIPQIALLQKESADVGLELTLPGKGESSAWAPVPLRSSNAGDEDEETEESSSDEDDPFEDEGKAEDTSPKVVVSGDITNLTSFFCPRVLRHKTFSKYVVRKKQGRVQWQADGQRGSSIQSAGAMVRRRNFEQFVAKLNSLLQEWAEELRRCERVFLVAPSYNREILLAEGTPLVGDNTNRPSYEECCRILKRFSFFGAILPIEAGAEAFDSGEEELHPSPELPTLPTQAGESDRYGVEGFRTETTSQQGGFFSFRDLELLQDGEEEEFPTTAEPHPEKIPQQEQRTGKKKRKKKRKKKKKKKPQPSAESEPPSLNLIPVPPAPPAMEDPPKFSCDYCAKPFSLDPFYRLDFMYCTTACLRQHRFELDKSDWK